MTEDTIRKEKNKKIIVLQYAITAVAGLIIMFIVCFSRGIFAQISRAEVFKLLSDGAFLSAALIGGIGTLVFAGNGGLFDIFAYGLQSLLSVFSKRMHERKSETFFDYRTAKQNRKSSFAFMLIVGMIFLAVSALFAFLYSSATV